jgi:pentatricopeptide repeat protein
MIVKAEQVTQQLLSCCSLADSEASKALINIKLKEGNVDAVIDVLHDMARDGLLPSPR